MSLIDELQRRKVFKVGGAYVVVAWLVIQVASIVFPAFDAPPWVLRVFILISLLGFPIAVVTAWMFDAGPDGVHRDGSRTGGKGVYAAATVLAMLALGWYFYGQPTFRRGDVETPNASDPRSIAVLPFENMSGDPKQEYFSDGMTEELLDVLAKVPQLKVVARTSVFVFKGKGGDVREIGRKLGVANIVEGSVRRDGEQVRITAQLVRVSDGFHVWSQTYDRKLEGLFALQDEIAQNIGQALQESLGVVTPIAARTPIDPAAYDDYLKGRALLRQRRDMPGAIAHFKAAVARAPQFAEGWSSLSLAEDTIYWYVPMDKAQAVDWLAQAAEAAERAKALAPDAAPTQHLLGNAARERFDYVSAEQHYLRSIAADPSYPDVREDYSELLYQVGRMQDSAAATRQVVQLDPYYIVGWMRQFDAASALDNRKEAEHALERLRELDPNNIYAIYGAVDYALAHGREAEARAAALEIEAHHPVQAAFVRALLPWVFGDPAADERAASAALKSIPTMKAGTYLVARGDTSGFLEFIDRAGPLDQTYFFAKMFASSAAGRAMLADPQVKSRLIDFGFVAYWRAKGWPAGCRALGDTDFECGPDATKAVALRHEASPARP